MTHHRNRDVDTTYQADASRNSMSFAVEQSDMKDFIIHKKLHGSEPCEHLGPLSIDDGGGGDLTKKEHLAIVAKKEEEAKAIIAKKEEAAAEGGGFRDDDAVVDKKLAAEDIVMKKKLAAMGKLDDPTLKEVVFEQGMIAYKSALNTWDKLYS
jgi:hypothetical protein